MSAIEIINELPKLTPAELKAVRRKVLDMTSDEPSVDLRARGIAEKQAADLRSRLKTFAEDWERPEASVYDQAPAR